jgi:hypothetical protein
MILRNFTDSDWDIFGGASKGAQTCENDEMTFVVDITGIQVHIPGTDYYWQMKCTQKLGALLLSNISNVKEQDLISYGFEKISY